MEYSPIQIKISGRNITVYVHTGTDTEAYTENLCIYATIKVTSFLRRSVVILAGQ